MDDRERGLAFLFAITLPPVMVWFLVAKFTYGIDPSTAKYLIPYLVKNTFSLWPLWSALIAGWFIGVGGLIAFIIYDKSRVFKGERFKKIIVVQSLLAPEHSLIKHAKEVSTS
ncbi:hypothetical protein [Klebsiella variicola]|uniref:hypothetical protein n=1 Tax=Klebsiella variicola TaxID=244366 RepID=UPI001E2E0E98|nr:hypothetical protein [Klebsiella variicola]